MSMCLTNPPLAPTETFYQSFLFLIKKKISGIFRQMAHTANIRVIRSRLVGAVSTRTRPFGIRDRLFKGR
jgi:hypothetical protein